MASDTAIPGMASPSNHVALDLFTSSLPKLDPLASPNLLAGVADHVAAKTFGRTQQYIATTNLDRKPFACQRDNQVATGCDFTLEPKSTADRFWVTHPPTFQVHVSIRQVGDSDRRLAFLNRQDASDLDAAGFARWNEHHHRHSGKQPLEALASCDP